MKHLLPLLVLAVGCTDADDDGTTPTGNETDNPGASTFQVLANEMPGGAYLSGFGHDDGIIFAGGRLGGGVGSLAYLTDDGLCVEEGVTDQGLWWIHGTDADNWYAVGENGVILHNDGGTFVREDVDTDAILFGVYMGEDDVWAIGGKVGSPSRGEIWRKTGGEWSLAAELPALGFKVYGDVFVGDGWSSRWDGEQFVDIPHAGGEELRRLMTVHSNGEHTLAIGDGQSRGYLLQLTDDGWADVAIDDEVCQSQGQNGVFVTPEGTVLTAGFNGSSSFDEGSGWMCEEFPSVFEGFHATLEHDGTYYYIGGDWMGSPAAQYGTIQVYGPPIEPLEVGACD